uniref:chitinase n=1 Tax=Anopheles atroparvus TaxID=41427 RepID=A0A182IVU9_ANOAO
MVKCFVGCSVILLVLLATASLADETVESKAPGAEKKIVCYVGTWAVYRPGRGRFDIEHIDPTLCTHLMYGFFGINENATVRVIDPYLDLEENWGRGHIKRFVALKNGHPGLKTMAAVGGWNEGSRKFSKMAASAELRKRFIYDSVAFCQRHGFDGIDLDWDFHFLNVMVYDMHGAWDDYCGINAPLYRGSADTTDVQLQLNVNASVHYWLAQGAPAEKLVLGIPLYGRSFTLANAANSQIGAATIGGGTAGPYTQQAGVLGYNEFCEKLQTEAWDLRWSDEQQVPYAVRNNQWLGYDDLRSIQLKVKYLLDLGLGGAMVWSLETDDFLGFCNGVQYPLMKEIRQLLNGGTPSPTTAPVPTSPPTSTGPGVSQTGGPTIGPSTSPSTTDEPCVGAPVGFVPHPRDCSRYFICLGNDTGIEFTCPAGTLFDPTLNVCNWADNVNCESV